MPGSEIEPAALAAVVAAVEATWPRPGGTGTETATDEPARWRFSARWWARPAVSRRRRPW